MGDLDNPMPRERLKKDGNQLLVNHKKISGSIITTSRCKKKRSESQTLEKEQNVCGDATTDTFGKTNVENFVEEGGTSLQILQFTEKSRIQDKSDNVGTGYVSSNFPTVPKIPRRLRTAILKRPHELPQSAVVGDGQELVSKNDKENCSFMLLLPGISHGCTNSEKKLKCGTSGFQLAKVESLEISDEEVEVLEALFDLANQAPHPPSTGIKSESEVENKNVGAAWNCMSATDVPIEFSPSAHSFGPVAPASEKMSSFFPPAAAPKRKRPRVLPCPKLLLESSYQVAAVTSSPRHTINISANISTQKREAAEQVMEEATFNPKEKEHDANIALEEHNVTEIPTNIKSEGKQSLEMTIANLTNPYATNCISVSDHSRLGDLPRQSKFQRALMKDNLKGGLISQEQFLEGMGSVLSYTKKQVQRQSVCSNEQDSCQELGVSDKSARLQHIPTVSSHLRKNVPMSASATMSLPGWLGPLPALGQYDPFIGSATATRPAIPASLRETFSERADNQFTTQLPSKLCTLHVRIARFIKVHQKLSQHLPFVSTSGSSLPRNEVHNMQAPLNTANSFLDNIGAVCRGASAANWAAVGASNEIDFGINSSMPSSAKRKSSKEALFTLFSDAPQQNQYPLRLQQSGITKALPKLQMMESVDPYTGKLNGTNFGRHLEALYNSGVHKTESGTATDGAPGYAKGLISMTAAQAQYLQAFIQKNHLPVLSKPGSLLSSPSQPGNVQADQNASIPVFDSQMYRPHPNCNHSPTMISATVSLQSIGVSGSTEHHVSGVSSAPVKQLNLENELCGQLYSGFGTEALPQSFSSLVEGTSLGAGSVVLFQENGKAQSPEKIRHQQLRPQCASSGSLGTVANISLQSRLTTQDSQNSASFVAASMLASAMTCSASTPDSMNFPYACALKSVINPKHSLPLLAPQQYLEEVSRKPSSACIVRPAFQAQSIPTEETEQQSQLSPSICLQTSTLANTSQQIAAAPLMRFPILCGDRVDHKKTLSIFDKHVDQSQLLSQKSVFLQQYPSEVQLQGQSLPHSESEQIPAPDQFIKTTLHGQNQLYGASWCSQQPTKLVLSVDPCSQNNSPAIVSHTCGYESIQPTSQDNSLHGSGQANACSKKQLVVADSVVCVPQDSDLNLTMHSTSGSPESNI